jgi:hypothetical protein
VLLLYLYTLHGPVLHHDGPTIHKALAVPGHILTTGACATSGRIYGVDYGSLCCSWTCLQCRPLCCTWKCRLHHRGLNCTWTNLDNRNLCYIGTLAKLQEACATSGRILTIGACAAPGLVYTSTLQHCRGLCCTWTCLLHHRGLSCTWTYNDNRSLCYIGR